MSDDLGRGLLNWTADRWQALDTLAGTTVTEQVVLRNVVDYKEQADARSVRIAGQNLDVENVESNVIQYNMEDEDEQDLERKVRLAAQELATKEDEEIIAAMNPTSAGSAGGFEAFSRAKAMLNQLGVRAGFGVVLSADALSTLEIQPAGNQTGLEVAKKILGTQFSQTNALPTGQVAALIFQAVPAAFKLVKAWGPRLRVLSVNGGTVQLRLEEGIAIGVLEANRCVSLTVPVVSGVALGPQPPSSARVSQPQVSTQAS
jgi:uncharacterized linocin/CFP29 family protein